MVTDASAASNGIQLKNGFPIRFAVSAALPSGQSIPQSNSDFVDVPSIPIEDSLGSADAVNVAANGNEWTLRVYQNDQTRAENVIEYEQLGLETVMSLEDTGNDSTGCIKTVSAQLATSKVTPALAVGKSASDVLDIVEKSLSDSGTYKDLGDFYKACLQNHMTGLPEVARQKVLATIARVESGTFAVAVKALYARLKVYARNTAASLAVLAAVHNPEVDIVAIVTAGYNVYLVYKNRETLLDAANFSVKSFALVTYWSTDKDFSDIGVCEGKGASGTLSVINCASSFKLSPESKTISVGDKFTYDLSAFDKNNSLTLVPSGLRWQSSSSAVSVDQQGHVAANQDTVAPVEISVVDDITKVSASAQITVVNNTSLSPLPPRCTSSEVVFYGPGLGPQFCYLDIPADGIIDDIPGTFLLYTGPTIDDPGIVNISTIPLTRVINGKTYLEFTVDGIAFGDFAAQTTIHLHFQRVAVDLSQVYDSKDINIPAFYIPCPFDALSQRYSCPSI